MPAVQAAFDLQCIHTDPLLPPASLQHSRHCRVKKIRSEMPRRKCLWLPELRFQFLPLKYGGVISSLLSFLERFAPSSITREQWKNS